MSRAPGSSGVRVACIALAGTIGAMGTLGHRRGGAVELFVAGGHQVLARMPLVVALLVGVVIHALWMFFWAFILAALARHHRGMRATVEAAAIAAVAFATSVLLPAALLGPMATLTIGERALVHVVLAVSLVIGMRLAFAGDDRVV